MPNLGQGGCQAIEDAYVLGDLLSNTRTTEKLEDTLQTFYRKRILRVSAVQFLSKQAFDTPWSPHDNLGTSWKSYLTFVWKPVLQYIFFPLLFAYLYSYHPTGRMDDRAAALEAAWKIKHKADAEAAFAEARSKSSNSFILPKVRGVNDCSAS
jgi:zeaxanthin epoxidase